MKKNTLIKRLKNGEYVLGTWCVLPHSSVVNVIASAGFDYVIIDLEHGPMSFEKAEEMVRTAESEGCTPILRVPANKDWLILRGLEIGSHGIIVPQIATKVEANYALTAMKYHPKGTRGFSPYTRSGGYNSIYAKRLAAEKNKEIMTILIIEGIDGIKNLDEILSLHELDVIYLGTYDLTQSAGHPGEPDHPEVVEFVKKCVEKIKKKGVVVGCLAENQEEIKKWKKLGIQMIAYKADCGILHQACLDIKKRFK
jgi:4-hydroxy-2-oxoheptanedioate aldolase